MSRPRLSLDAQNVEGQMEIRDQASKTIEIVAQMKQISLKETLCEWASLHMGLLMTMIKPRKVLGDCANYEIDVA